jgi:hypothetical protein
VHTLVKDGDVAEYVAAIYPLKFDEMLCCL